MSTAQLRVVTAGCILTENDVDDFADLCRSLQTLSLELTRLYRGLLRLFLWLSWSREWAWW